jgi:hypothetical protein
MWVCHWPAPADPRRPSHASGPSHSHMAGHQQAIRGRPCMAAGCASTHQADEHQGCAWRTRAGNSQGGHKQGQGDECIGITPSPHWKNLESTGEGELWEPPPHCGVRIDPREFPRRARFDPHAPRNTPSPPEARSAEALRAERPVPPPPGALTDFCGVGPCNLLRPTGAQRAPRLE